MKEETRLVLAQNLKALMAARPNLATFKQIVAAGGPSNGTLDRIRRAGSGCSVDQIDLLAKVFELDAWQLLVPDLKPNNAPILLGAGGEVERALWDKIDKLMSEVKELREGGATMPGDFDEMAVERFGDGTPSTRVRNPGKRSSSS